MPRRRSSTSSFRNSNGQGSSGAGYYWQSHDSMNTEGFDKSMLVVDPAADEEGWHLRREDDRPPVLWKNKGRRMLGAVLSGFSFFIPGKNKKTDDIFALLPSGDQLPGRSFRRSRVPRHLRCVLFLIVGILVMLGIIQFISIACAVVISLFPDEFDRAATNWLNPEHPADDISHWPTDISRDIIPVGCHSHNDYWRRVPLYSALQAGCIGIEADVWFIDEDQHRHYKSDLYVGHTISSLTPGRTLRNMYVDPLVKILDRQNPIPSIHLPVDQPRKNGVFDTDPSQTVILLVDFKTDGAVTFPHVDEQLAPLRERGYLAYFNGEEVVDGPVTVVGTGNTPFDLVTANSTYRDIFFDAPLDYLTDDSLDAKPARPPQNNDGNNNLGQGLSGASPGITPDAFNHTSSFYASTSFSKSIGHPWPFHLTAQQIDKVRAQINGAHRRGLKVRYWGLPSWPRSLRNYIWRVLVHEGVDILNVDDLWSASRGDWRAKLLDGSW